MQRVWIDDTQHLEEAVRAWKAAPVLAIDTEFVRERTFFPRLGLVQVSDGDHVALIDPLAIEDLGPLAEILTDPSSVKLAHSPSEDLEVLYHELGVFPRPLFDTQAAAALAGHGDSLGYQRLVEILLGVELEKGETRTNWCKRPLTDAQLHYAAQDVIHLLPAYERLRAELEPRDRVAWVFEDVARLADPCRFLPPPEESVWRLKGIGRLNRRQLAAASDLAEWREREARRRDLPRGFVLRDTALLEMARRLPLRMQELGRIRDLHPRQIEREGKDLLERIAHARARAPHELPKAPPRLPRSEAVSESLQDLVEVVRATAERLEIPAPSLASRRELKELLLAAHQGEAGNGSAPPPPFDGWRWEVLGEAVTPILDRVR